MSQYDVIVIGSGPAGSAAAIASVKEGLSVLLLADKKKKDNGCQPVESVHPGITSLLAKLGANDCLTEATIGQYEGIQSGNSFVSLGADENEIWHGYHIDKKRFEELFLRKAIRRGVIVLKEEKAVNLLSEDGFIMGVKTHSNKHITAKYVIDASGHSRFAGKKLKFEELFFSPPLVSQTGISTGIPSGSSLFKNKFAKFIPRNDGWTWLAPLNAGKCAWTQLWVKGTKTFDAPEPLKKNAAEGTVRTANVRWRLFRPLCKEGIILCGDAAGVLDPAAGQGILNALYSGIKAAECVVSCINTPDHESLMLARYDDWFCTFYLDKVKKLSQYYKEHAIG